MKYLVLALSLLACPVMASEPTTDTPLINELLVGAIALPGEDLVFEGNVYHCYTDWYNGPPRTVCKPVGTTRPSAINDPAELQAAHEAALFQVPVRPRLDWQDGAGMTEYCRGSVHGDCSGACRITAVLPNGDVIVECGER